MIDVLATSDRVGRGSQETVVKGVILSLVQVEEYKKKGALDLYQEVFESEFLRASGDYYRREAEKLLLDCDCSTYMEKVLQKLDSENMRARKYLHPSSYPRITQECEARMIADHLNVIGHVVSHATNVMLVSSCTGSARRWSCWIAVMTCRTCTNCSSRSIMA